VNLTPFVLRLQAVRTTSSSDRVRGLANSIRVWSSRESFAPENSMPRLLIALALAALSSSAMAEYSFDVSNNSDQRIIAIEASEDGSNWGEFDIGSGIPSGETMTLVWDSSTDDGNCEWEFRATFAEGHVSEPSVIDFCEGDLEIEFDFD
jgi:hypothetical protein